MKLAQLRNLSSNLKKTARTSSSSRNPLTNLMKRSRCTRGSWKNKNQFLTPWPFPPVHQQNSLPPPPFNPQETCALAPSMPPATVELGLWLVQDQHTELPALGQGLWLVQDQHTELP